MVEFLSKEIETPIHLTTPTDGEQMLEALEKAASQTVDVLVAIALNGRSCLTIETLNLHREKLRRGASVLLFLPPSALSDLQTIGQDAHSFRDTTVFITGFRAPAIHIPSLDSPLITLARARAELPGTPYEKALAAADLALLLLDRGYAAEAYEVCTQSIQPFVRGEAWENAGRGTIAHLAGTVAAVVAAAGFVLGARHWFALAHNLRLETGHHVPDEFGYAGLMTADLWQCSTLTRAVETVASSPDLPEYEAAHGRIMALLYDHLGTPHQWFRPGDPPKWDVNEPIARGIITSAMGDFAEAEAAWLQAAEREKKAHQDNRSSLAKLAICLMNQGESLAAADVYTQLSQRETERSSHAHLASVSAPILLSTGDLQRVWDLREAPARPATVGDGLLYEWMVSSTQVLIEAVNSGRWSGEQAASADAYLDEVHGWFPLPPENDAPIYQVLLPLLKIQRLNLHPERRGEALKLARSAFELANEKVQLFYFEAALALIDCLFAIGQLDEMGATILQVESVATEAGYVKHLAALRARRFVAEVLLGVESSQLDKTLASLRETFQASGSNKLRADTLWTIVSMLPETTAAANLVELLDEAADLYAAMPYPLMEERCRERKADLYLARGNRAEAAALYSAAAKRLTHYQLLLRVPLLHKKAQVALGAGNA
ncbi:MAG: hypothetical protein IPK82_36370 [Polyangiaceae bacterium]|nr:hypothetical protein [Polyangiaceae bacterium]